MAKGLGFQINTNSLHYILVAINQNFIWPEEKREYKEDEGDKNNSFDECAGHRRGLRLTIPELENITNSLTFKSIDIFQAICDR